jgi:2,5-furandicarboxylate decarboxylase 1
MVDYGPVQDVVMTGDDVDLAKIPVVVNCEKDSGAFITIGITVVKDPDTGIRNSGVYRMMVLGKNTLGMSYEKHTHIGHIHRKMIAQNKPLEVVTFIGHHPACMIGSQSKVPLGVDEWEVMGGLMQEPLEIVKCKTVDLEVPAWAEIAIEGVIYPDEVAPEGPFGEYTWYYGLERRSPVMHVTAITHRKDAIYQHLFAAHPEHNYTGQLGRESVLFQTGAGNYSFGKKCAYADSWLLPVYCICTNCQGI